LDIRLIALATLCALWVAPVMAQSSPAPAEQSAMERAQREADGPRRRILEAAKVKGTVKAAEPAGAAPVATASASAAAASAPVAVAPKVVAREEPEPDRLLVTQPTAVEPVAMPASAVATVPAMAKVELAPVSAALIALPQPRADTLLPPQLVSKVDPEMPPRLVRRSGGRRTELVVELTIQPDGSVSNVAVRSPADDDLVEAVRGALLQWRYEPQPVVRPHVVQLVFGQS
jgi:hypothetical protein